MSLTETVTMHLSPDETKLALSILRRMVGGPGGYGEIGFDGNADTARLRLISQSRAPKSMGVGATIEERMEIRVNRESLYNPGPYVTFGFSFCYSDTHTVALVLIEALTDRKQSGLYLSADPDDHSLRILANERIFLVYEPGASQQPGYISRAAPRYERVLQTTTGQSVQLECIRS